MNPQVERAVEHFRALLEEQIARAERLEREPAAAARTGKRP